MVLIQGFIALMGENLMLRAGNMELLLSISLLLIMFIQVGVPAVNKVVGFVGIQALLILLYAIVLLDSIPLLIVSLELLTMALQTFFQIDYHVSLILLQLP